MKRNSLLWAYQQFLLLGLRDDRGTTLGWTSYALGGALLADLMLTGRVTLDGKRELVTIESDEPMGDPVLDDCLTQIATAKRRAAAQRWVSRFARRPTFHAAAEQLCGLGILRMDNRSVLLLFSRRVYPEIDPVPEREIVERLRAAIFTDEPADSETVVVLSLADAAGLLPHHFPKKELRARKAHIKAIADADAVGAATAKVIQGVQAAIVASTVAAAVAASG